MWYIFPIVVDMIPVTIQVRGWKLESHAPKALYYRKIRLFNNFCLLCWSNYIITLSKQFQKNQSKMGIELKHNYRNERP